MKCTYCGGKGWMSCLKTVFDPVSKKYVTCPECNGKGSVTCPHCGGTGREPKR